MRETKAHCWPPLWITIQKVETLIRRRHIYSLFDWSQVHEASFVLPLSREVNVFIVRAGVTCKHILNDSVYERSVKSRTCTVPYVCLMVTPTPTNPRGSLSLRSSLPHIRRSFLDHHSIVLYSIKRVTFDSGVTECHAVGEDGPQTRIFDGCEHEEKNVHHACRG
jgi:hypothetical protein